MKKPGCRILISALALVLGAAGIQALPAMAQTSKELTERYESWQVKCVTDGGDDWKQCSMFQEILQNDSGKRVLQISFGKAQPDAMMILTPFGLQLQKGVALEADGTGVGRADFVICRPFGCVARYDLDVPALAQLKAGAELKLIGMLEDDRQLVIMAPLAGFAAAHGRLLDLAAD